MVFPQLFHGFGGGRGVIGRKKEEMLRIDGNVKEKVKMAEDKQSKTRENTSEGKNSQNGGQNLPQNQVLTTGT